MGADRTPDDTPAPAVVTTPFAGVDQEEWGDLVERGRDTGELHAEDVAHVLRHVELTGDVLVEVQSALTERGITIDAEVENDEGQVEDKSPPRALHRPRHGHVEHRVHGALALVGSLRRPRRRLVRTGFETEKPTQAQGVDDRHDGQGRPVNDLCRMEK